MKFKTNTTVRGAVTFNDTVDGTRHDFTKIFVDVDLSEQRGIGSCTVEYKWGVADNIKKIQELKFPFEAELSMEIVTTGNKQLTIVHDVKPLPIPAKA